MASDLPSSKEGLSKAELADRLSSTAFAFRGYNTTNLGCTPELLGITAYRPILESHLRDASELCSELIGKPVDLVQSVADRHETSLDNYAEAVAVIFAVELAQINILREWHGIDIANSALAFGYSLGELAAVVVAGVAEAKDVLSVPLSLAADCAELAHEVTMGIVFSRGAALEEADIHGYCEEITAEGKGTLAISAVLSPNTMLVLGQGETLGKLKQRLAEFRILVRRNDSLWPPLHTSIVSQRCVPDRAAVMIERIQLLAKTPSPPILSLVTGEKAYGDGQSRSVLRHWVDHPQRLWDGVCGVLENDIRTIVHVGPEPNVIPATFQRLAENVAQQTGKRSLSGLGLRAVQHMVKRPWLASLLPKQSSLLRAPGIHHVLLEDWLLTNAPGDGA